MKRVLQVRDLRKSFASELVLEKISFQVPEHSATVFIGASGSGKSTLLRCINLLEQIDDGVIEFEGRDISAIEVDSDEVRQKQGMVFQSFNLFPHMSVLENVILAPTRVQRIAREEAIHSAMELLERFGLREKANEYPDRLSGGQQQRVAIIRSIARKPRLLLLDEITSALDPVLVNEVLSTVRDLKEDGMTMVIATHEMGFAKRIADEICFLYKGRIIESGPPEKLLGAPRAVETQDYLKKVHMAGRL